MKVKILIVVLVLLATFVVLLLNQKNRTNLPIQNTTSTVTINDECEGDIMNATLSKVDTINRNTNKYASSTKELLGLTTEGGVQIDYTDKNLRVLVAQHFYGETYHSIVNYYYDNSSPILINTQRLEYNAPITVEPFPVIKSTTTNMYFLDPKGKLCMWQQNNEIKSTDIKSQDFVNSLLKEILQ